MAQGVPDRLRPWIFVTFGTTRTLVVPNVTKIRGLNLPGTPWATSACCGRPLPFNWCGRKQPRLILKCYWGICVDKKYRNSLKRYVRNFKRRLLEYETDFLPNQAKSAFVCQNSTGPKLLFVHEYLISYPFCVYNHINCSKSS